MLSHEMHAIMRSKVEWIQLEHAERSRGLCRMLFVLILLGEVRWLGSKAYAEGGVPVFSSWETAVTSCAGAKGLVRRMLLGTPFEGHSSALSPIM